MDDFDRLLEFKLRRMLDAIVAKPPPVRRGRRWPRRAGGGPGHGPRVTSFTRLEPMVVVAPAPVMVPVRFH